MTAEIRLNAVEGDCASTENEFPSTLNSQFAHPPTKQKRPSTAFYPTLPGYEILHEIGRAGMGVVYKAWQVKEERLVAIKMLRDGIVAGAEQFERFYNEAQILSGLQHPNIVQIFEVGEQEGRLYMVLQFAEGGSLADYLSHHRFPFEESVALIEILARAMSHVHQHGILHRDLKPANILLQIVDLPIPDKSQERARSNILPMIADFGLGKRTDSQDQTISGAILGTPSYMSPEQARGISQAVGPRCDVYSLGAILYEMLTGSPPFRGPTILDTLEMVRDELPVPPRELRPEITPDLEALCLKCLEKDPEQRYGSALELAKELRQFQNGLPLQCTGSTSNEGELRRKQIQSAIEQGLLHLKDERPREAVLWLSEAFRLEEGQPRFEGAEQVHRYRLHQLLQQCPQILQVWTPSSPVSRIAVSPRGDIAISAHEDGSLQQLDLTTGKTFQFEGRHKASINRVVFTNDGHQVATASDDCTACVWCTASGRPLSMALVHKQWVTSVEISPCGSHLATACADGTVWVWDWKAGQPLFPAAKHGGMLWSVGFNYDGSRVLSTGWDGFARLWDARSGAPIASAAKHSAWCRQAVFSADGSRFATASDDKTARIWSTETGEPLTLPLRHDHPVHRVAFVEQDRILLTWASNNRVGIWDAQSGKPLSSPVPSYLIGGDPQNSPDGRRLLKVSREGFLHLYDCVSSRNQEKPVPEQLRDEALLSHFLQEGAPEELGSEAWQWPVEDLVLLGKLLTGKQIDSKGQMQSLSQEELEAANRELQQRHPHQFRVNQSQGEEWHQAMIRRCSELGLYGSAWLHANRLVQMDPGRADFRAQRARCRLKGRLWHQAIENYSQALDLKPKEAAYWLERGMAYAKAEQWEKAASDFQQAIELEPTWGVTYLQLTRTYLYAKDYHNALLSLSRMIDRNVQAHRALIIRAGILAHCRQWDQAIADFEAAEAKGASRPEVLALHALVCLRNGNREAYRGLLSRLLDQAESTEGWDGAWAAWVGSLTLSSEWAERILAQAQALIQKVQGLDELAGFARTALGAALYRAGQTAQAIEVLELQPGNGCIQDWLYLSLAYHSQGRPKQARRSLRKAHRWLQANHNGMPRVQSLPWHQKAEIRILRDEAESLIREEDYIEAQGECG